jgi:hypothetical protein
MQEWRSQLRSSLHPELFAGVYLAAAKLAAFCGLTLPSQAELYIAAPKVTQAVAAALLDYYTWKLAGKAYGQESRTAFTTVGNRVLYSASRTRKIMRQFPIIDFCVTIACIVRRQPVAVVLLDPNIIQLP